MHTTNPNPGGWWPRLNVAARIEDRTSSTLAARIVLHSDPAQRNFNQEQWQGQAATSGLLQGPSRTFKQELQKGVALAPYQRLPICEDNAVVRHITGAAASLPLAAPSLSPHWPRTFRSSSALGKPTLTDATTAPEPTEPRTAGSPDALTGLAFGGPPRAKRNNFNTL